MKKREIKNFAYHVLLCLALAALVLVHRNFLLLATFVYMALREQAQHRYILTELSHLSYPAYSIQKRTFWDFGWVTWKRFGEVMQGVLGCAIALGGYELFLWLR